MKIELISNELLMHLEANNNEELSVCFETIMKEFRKTKLINLRYFYNNLENNKPIKMTNIKIRTYQHLLILFCDMFNCCNWFSIDFNASK